jgi:hypothetical protein
MFGAMRLNPRLQGDLGERSAMLWFGARGAAVFTPVFHSPDDDLIAGWGHGLVRVQVKTSNCFLPPEALGRDGLHPGRQPKLERLGQTSRPLVI